MHIALVTHRFVRGDGQGRVNLEVAAAALRRGWKVTLVASDVAAELRDHMNVDWVRIDVRRWPTELVRNQLFAFASWRWLARNRRHIDVVLVNGFITWAVGDYAAAHFVHSAWLRSPYRTADSSVRGVYQHIYTRLNSALERWAYRRATGVVAVSQQVRRQLVESGVPEQTVRVIPNGVDTSEFAPGAEQLPAPAGRGAAVTGLFVGDLNTTRKNLLTVLRALSRSPQVRMVVAGTVGASPYPRMARELGVADRVTFLGFRKDVPALMRAADFVIFPSLYEPSGLVLLEGMASAKPVITTRTVGGVELLDSACAIVLDDPEDPEAMAAAMDKLARSPDLRAEMGKEGRQRALSLDFTAMAEAYCELFATHDTRNRSRSGARGAPPALPERLPMKAEPLNDPQFPSASDSYLRKQ
jgi:glycosyltransferase involved in cell wall biosynthesis